MRPRRGRRIVRAIDPLPTPKIVAAAEEAVGGGFKPGQLVDGLLNTAYASNGKGTDTFVEFDFGTTRSARRPVPPRRPQRSGLGRRVAVDVYRRGRPYRWAQRRFQHVGRRAGLTLFVSAQAGHGPKSPLAGHEVGQQLGQLRRRPEIAFFTDRSLGVRAARHRHRRARAGGGRATRRPAGAAAGGRAGLSLCGADRCRAAGRGTRAQARAIEVRQPARSVYDSGG